MTEQTERVRRLEDGLVEIAATWLDSAKATAVDPMPMPATTLARTRGAGLCHRPVRQGSAFSRPSMTRPSRPRRALANTRIWSAAESVLGQFDRAARDRRNPATTPPKMRPNTIPRTS